MGKKIIVILSFFSFGCTLPSLDRVLLDTNIVLWLLKQSSGSIEISVDKPSFQVLRRFEPIEIISSSPGVPIFYTTDGSEPTVDSPQIVGEFYPNDIAPGQTILVKAIQPSGVGSNTLELRYFYPYLKTGQTNCYNYSTNALEPCDVTHTDQDGRLQKGTAIQYRPTYTNPGFPNDQITKDDVFGLTWTSCRLGFLDSNCSTGAEITVTGEFTNPEDQCNLLNSANTGQGFAGIKNWRLPEPLEAESTAIYELSPAIQFDGMAFPNLSTGGSILFHSVRSTIISSRRYYQRIAQRFYGSQSEASTGSVLCVSGPKPPTPIYSDLGDGTIRDELRGLLWTKCLAGQTLPTCAGASTGMAFVDSIDYCRNLGLAGKTWRLPHLRELDTMSNPYESLGTPKLYPISFLAHIAGTVLRSSTSESTTSARRLTVDDPHNSTGGPAASKVNNTVKVICVTEAR